jgi:hypothetical protein
VTGLPIRPQDWPRKALDWLCAGRADYEAFKFRRHTRRHRILRGRCKNVWIMAGVAILLNPAPGFILSISLFATVLSFAVLDETEQIP